MHLLRSRRWQMRKGSHSHTCPNLRCGNSLGTLVLVFCMMGPPEALGVQMTFCDVAATAGTLAPASKCQLVITGANAGSAPLVVEQAGTGFKLCSKPCGTTGEHRKWSHCCSLYHTVAHCNTLHAKISMSSMMTHAMNARHAVWQHSHDVIYHAVGIPDSV